jgi:hypothetical protein
MADILQDFPRIRAVRTACMLARLISDHAILAGQVSRGLAAGDAAGGRAGRVTVNVGRESETA